MYMGGKNRISKYLIPVMESNRRGRTWVEPFIGGGNTIDKVGGTRIGADINHYLIDFWGSIQKGWVPPNHVTKDEYHWIKQNKEHNTTLTLWAGISCSYGGKWFGGWINDYGESKRRKDGSLPNHQKESKRSVLKQVEKIKNIKLVCCSYDDLEIPPDSLIYCDPPYAGTEGYKDAFDNSKFWQWCRDKSAEGHQVYISEYSAPDDFLCVKEIKTITQLGNGVGAGNQKRTEKLFIAPSKELQEIW